MQSHPHCDFLVATDPSIVVPIIGADVILSVPSSAITRSRMPASPIPSDAMLFGTHTNTIIHNPQQSLSILYSQPNGSRVSMAVLCYICSASCAIRYKHRETSVARGGTFSSAKFIVMEVAPPVCRHRLRRALARPTYRSAKGCKSCDKSRVALETLGTRSYSLSRRISHDESA